MKCTNELPSPQEATAWPRAPLKKLPSVGWIGWIDGIVLAPLLAVVLAEGIAYGFFRQFSRFAFYDDEGRQLLFVQHLLNGTALYDRVAAAYGPFYLFQRWLIFSVLGVPLGNDTFRLVTIATWCLTAVILAVTAWRLSRRTVGAAGVAAFALIGSVFYLRTLANEPGHPQELVALTLAVSMWLSAELWGRRIPLLLLLLGAIAAALLLIKVNIGLFFGLGVALTLLGLGPRRAAAWTVARAAALIAVPMLPTLLMSPRFGDGYEPLCIVVTAALFPCCLLALCGDSPGPFRFRHLLLFGAGAAGFAGLMIGFAFWQGNSTAGLIRSLIVHPHWVYMETRVGTPLEVPRFTLIWAVVAAAFGIAAYWWEPVRRCLGPLRVLACGLIVWEVQSGDMYDATWVFCALPLTWLMLVAPAGRTLAANESFFRVLLAFTVCLQPLQIFPVSGSQNHLGTVLMLLAAVVMMQDLLGGSIVVPETRFAPAIRRTVKSLLVLSPCVVLACGWAPANMLSRAISHLVDLDAPGVLYRLTILWSLAGAGLGLAALWGKPWVRRSLWPLKALVCIVILAEVFASGLRDTTSTALVLPLIWLVLIPPAGPEPQGKAWLLRLLLTMIASLQPLRIISAADSPMWSALVAAVLMWDLHNEAIVRDRPRVRTAILQVVMSLAILAPHRHAAVIDTVLYGLLIGCALAFFRGWRTGAGVKPQLFRGLGAAAAIWMIIAMEAAPGDTLAKFGRDMILQLKAQPTARLTSLWPSLAAGFGLALVWARPAGSRHLWVLRLPVCATMFAALLFFGPWDHARVYYAAPLTWLVLFPPGGRNPSARSWILRLFLTLMAIPGRLDIISGGSYEIPLDVLLTCLAAGVLLTDLCSEAAAFLRTREALAGHASRPAPAAEWNIMVASLAFMVGSQIAHGAAETYRAQSPIDLPGCRMTRMSERDASLYPFLAENVRASSDCFVARAGLASLHFWAHQPPASHVIIPNSWETIDAVADEKLLAAHRDRKQMMFIACLNPYPAPTYDLKFLNFVARNFKQYACVGPYRLLVRNERTDLKLYGCAYQSEPAQGAAPSSILHLRLPRGRELAGVASIELADLGTRKRLVSTEGPDSKRLVLSDGAGRMLLPPAGRSLPPALSAADKGLVLAFPESIELHRLEFAALKFRDREDRCLLTLPVVLDATVAVP